MSKEPGFRLHKPSGQAIVRLGGKMFYLGPFGSEESKTKYAKLKAEWLVSKNPEKFVRSPDGPTIASLCLAYLDHAEVYYGPGTELKNTRLAIQPISELYATLPTKEFSPLEYKTVRNWWLVRDCKRKAGRVSRQYTDEACNADCQMGSCRGYGPGISSPDTQVCRPAETWSSRCSRGGSH